MSNQIIPIAGRRREDASTLRCRRPHGLPLHSLPGDAAPVFPRPWRARRRVASDAGTTRQVVNRPPKQSTRFATAKATNGLINIPRWDRDGCDEMLYIFFRDSERYGIQIYRYVYKLLVFVHRAECT
ncbi:hypothetical protein EVAR_13000_1 [Eumeta japonica]|uniref:Uncharacterized protein n=1 Tax=Eumeta variegata TaxID=151549 RepID=A0A4C1TWY4_EUMVA|nr:hypothetical protein EVAR_13000_1 [Eumeta japonica]